MKEENPFIAGDLRADNRGIRVVIEKIFDIFHQRMLEIKALGELCSIASRGIHDRGSALKMWWCLS